MLTAVSTILVVLSLTNLVPEKSLRIRNTSNVSVITEVCDMIATEGKMYLVKIYPWPHWGIELAKNICIKITTHWATANLKIEIYPSQTWSFSATKWGCWSSCGLGLNSFLCTQHMEPAEEARTLTSTEDLGSFSSSSSLVYLVTFLD